MRLKDLNEIEVKNLRLSVNSENPNTLACDVSATPIGVCCVTDMQTCCTHGNMQA